MGAAKFFAHQGAKVRVTDLKSEEILKPLRGPSFGYRHKARLGVKYVTKKNKVLVGFREKNSRFLAMASFLGEELRFIIWKKMIYTCPARPKYQ